MMHELMMIYDDDDVHDDDVHDDEIQCVST